MANTTNLDLVKPLGTDHALISVINSNSDKIDAYAGETNDALATLQDGLAIVSDGDTHAAIASGQFVYVKNHSTLADGLYTASAAIAANAALTSSNVTADTSGGLNTLNSNIANLSWSNTTVTATHSGVSVNAVKYNSLMAWVTFTSASRTWSEGDSIATLPQGIYPSEIMRVTGNTYNSNVGLQVRFGTDGTIKYDSKTSIEGRISFTVMYPI